MFKVSGNENKKVCSKAYKIRLDREDYWTKTLRTVFSYGMNERTRKNDKGNDTSVWKLNPPIP